MLAKGRITATATALGSSGRVPARIPGNNARGALLVMNAGFGGSSKQGGSKSKAPKLARYLEVPSPSTPSSTADSSGWFKVPDVSFETTFLSKPIKAVILDTGKAICLYKVDSTIYCSDANSTAYQYPLADASLIQLKNGQPAVEVKLDGSVYELKTGRVVSWCPKNSLVRNVLGSLKDKTEPVDLPVYAVEVRGDDIWVNLSKPL
jgi:nitrite reductase/ring-hydroxylating ferredoxin subunit